MTVPKYQSIPVFSKDPEQNAEMTAEYFAECRYNGVDPYYAGDTDDDFCDECNDFEEEEDDE